MSHKFTLQRIKSVKTARLTRQKRVGIEFLVILRDDQNEKWIKYDQIASKTLASKLFREFYSTIDASIHNVPDLAQFLQNHKNTVELAIGDITQTFDIDSLRSLSYFNAMFSERWMNNRKNNNNNHAIKIFDNMPEQSAFGFEDLRLLLECVEIGEIPINLKPDINVLEGLINCNDYLTNKNDSIINETTLIEYFKHLKPRLNFQQRKKLTNQARNELLKTSLIKYNEEFSDKMNEMRNDLVSNITDLTKLNRIGFDIQTANALFVKKYKIISQFTDENETKLKIEITNFTTTDEFNKLWKQCSIVKELSIVKKVGLVELLVNLAKDNKTIIASIDTLNAISIVIHTLTSKSLSKKINLSQLGSNISILLVFVARWRLFHDKNGYYVDAQGAMVGCFQLEPNDFSSLMNLVFDKLIVYKQYYETNANTREEKRQRKLEAKTNFLEFIKQCILHLVSRNDKLIVNKAEIWFPIFHENDNKNCQWIINNVVNEMDADCAFDFGIYLTKYIGYIMKPNEELPQIYLDFLKNELGIEWTILPQGNEKN